MIKVRILGEVAATRQNPDAGGTVAVPIGSPEVANYLKAKIGDISDPNKYDTLHYAAGGQEDMPVKFKVKPPQDLKARLGQIQKNLNIIKLTFLKKTAATTQDAETVADDEAKISVDIQKLNDLRKQKGNRKSQYEVGKNAFLAFQNGLQELINYYITKEKEYFGDVPQWSEMEESQSPTDFKPLVVNQLLKHGGYDGKKIVNFIHSIAYSALAAEFKQQRLLEQYYNKKQIKLKEIINQVLQEMKQENEK